jgi:hypothetical protein
VGDQLVQRIQADHRQHVLDLLIARPDVTHDELTMILE